MSKLEKIVIQRRLDVVAAKEKVSVEELLIKVKQVEDELGAPKNLYDVIRDHQGKSKEMFVAAEFKRASPSKGDIAVDLDVGDQAKSYGTAGAGLISVLTEPKWFKGTLDDMLKARRCVNGLIAPSGSRPLILRKDFIIDEYQLYEARAYGADTVLLMLSILDEQQVKHLLGKARELGMEPLVEVVNDPETRSALRAGAKVLGVNNRNLHTFKVDMETTPNMVQVVRDSGHIDKAVVLALSGIKTRHDVVDYEKFGDIAGLLVGETLMRAPDPGAMIADLIRDAPGRGAVTRVKICGINDPESALVAAKAGADFIGIIFVEKSVRHATIQQAKDIVHAIREFREKDGRIEIPFPKVSSTNGSDGRGEQQQDSKRRKSIDANEDWFQAWGDVIGHLCDGQARPLVVGVFMNHPIDQIKHIVEETGIDLIQLHGSESLSDEADCPLPTIRVIHVDAAAKASEDKIPIKDSDLTKGPASLLLLDTSIKGGGSGGTGVTFDWAIAKHVHERTGNPVIMAGGLTPENVAEAVQAAQPWGVDVASGVEASPGKKDHDKIRAFIKAAKSSNNNNNS